MGQAIVIYVVLSREPEIAVVAVHFKLRTLFVVVLPDFSPRFEQLGAVLAVLMLQLVICVAAVGDNLVALLALYLEFAEEVFGDARNHLKLA